MQDRREETERSSARRAEDALRRRQMVLQPCPFHAQAWRDAEGRQHFSHQRSQTLRQGWSGGHVEAPSPQFIGEASYHDEDDLEREDDRLADQGRSSDARKLVVQSRLHVHSIEAVREHIQVQVLQQSQGLGCLWLHAVEDWRLASERRRACECKLGQEAGWLLFEGDCFHQQREFQRIEKEWKGNRS